MEASALRAPASISRLTISAPLLRLRSDDQLLALFRAGADEAFNVLHDRYRQRLFAYVRQMLSAHSRQDAEDVLQDVFVRAFGALRADERPVNVRAWLYRVAHNRCIDHLRRPMPAPADIFEMSRTPLHDPIEDAQRREDLRRLVTDVGRLPEQQRSALLMREIDGMSYADLASALDVTVPAVKSLLVRARLGLVEAAEARSTDCSVIREDLAAAYDRGVKASGRARRHMRECTGCREYRTALRGVRSSFAALTPGVGAAALAAKLFGIGGGGAAAGGAAASGGAAGGPPRPAWPPWAAPPPARSRPSHAPPRSPRAAPSRSRTSPPTTAPRRASTPPRPPPRPPPSRTPFQRRVALSSAAATAPAPRSAPAADRPAPDARARRETRRAEAPLAPPSIPVYEPGSLGGGVASDPVDEVSGGVTAPVEPPVSADPVPAETTPLSPETAPPHDRRGQRDDDPAAARRAGRRGVRAGQRGRPRGAPGQPLELR